MIDASLDFEITGGRHPVVEASLQSQGKAFAANDCDLGGAKGGQIAVVTGPNMAGKSTYLRQNALIAVLAQTGSYVPATSARIGVVDRLFSRVGASDDLARGRSTFMVEMVETAAILNCATLRSFVILDEIGRGTATFDGLSIAWATIEHLHEVNCSRAIFATHFHELTQLAKRLPRLVNLTMKVTDHAGEIVFLHEVIKGRRRPLLWRPCRAARRSSGGRRRARARHSWRVGSGGPARSGRNLDRRSAALCAHLRRAGAQGRVARRASRDRSGPDDAARSARGAVRIEEDTLKAPLRFKQSLNRW